MSRPSGAGSASSIIPVRLRQIALVSDDLRRAEDELTHVLGCKVIFRDPGVAQWGLENILLPLGGDIIEVVAPTRPGTAAGRLLSKRGGPGGYMIIMQTLDATARRDQIVAKGQAGVIWEHETADSHAVQYHPGGIRGGVIPELDSHRDAPGQLRERFGRWHACGPDYGRCREAMERHAHLSLLGCVLRLAPGDEDAESASKQWEDIFGIARNRDLLAFTNARMGFVPGRQGDMGGLLNITVGVKGRRNLDAILRRAEERGVLKDGGAVEMVGVRWYFSHLGEDAPASML